MPDLSTKYMGFGLKNPIIAGSCGLTNNLKSLLEMEKHGAAAVVLKSLFEEEINLEYESILEEANNQGLKNEELDYFDYKIQEKIVDDYLELIHQAKSELEIPVIASVNCISDQGWVNFANKIEQAGADALEVNISIFPSGFQIKPEEIENRYFSIVNQLIKKINIPLALKISPYFTNLPMMINKLSATAINALVLFNRYYNPDFDIDSLKLTAKSIFSTSKDSALPLRYISIMYNRVNCDLAASTGIHEGEDVVKQILAGATAVQVVSTLYNKGSQQIKNLIDFLNQWMENKKYSKLSDFRGIMSQSQGTDPAAYERVQFMRFFSGKF